MQYNVYLINLDPSIGHEIQKTLPCLVISPDEMNDNLGTVIVAPMTTKSHSYPSRVEVSFKDKKGRIVLDQIRTVDKRRLIKDLGVIDASTVHKVKTVLQEMLVD